MPQLPLALLRAAPRYTAIRSCRRVAGRRFAVPNRAFHKQSFLQNRQDDSTNTSSIDNSRAASGSEPSAPEGSAPQPDIAQQESTDGQEVQSNGAERPPKSSESPVHGSAKKRFTRNRLQEKIEVPSWFLENNVHQYGEPTESLVKAVSRLYLDMITDLFTDQTLRTRWKKEMLARGKTKTGLADSSTKMKEKYVEFLMRHVKAISPYILKESHKFPSRDKTSEASAEGKKSSSNGAQPPEVDSTHTVGGEKSIYNIDENIMHEIQLAADAGLRLDPKSDANDKPHLVLQSPQEGAGRFLASIVQQIGERSKVDIVRLDAEGIAGIAEEHEKVLPDSILRSLQSLRYDTFVMPDDTFSAGIDEGDKSEDRLDEDEEPREGQWKSTSSSIPIIGSQNMPTSPSFSKVLRQIFPDIKSYRIVGAMPLPQQLGSSFNSEGSTNPVSSDISRQFIEQSRLADKELFVSVIDKYLDSPYLKRTRSKGIIPSVQDDSKEESHGQNSQMSEASTRGFIVHIEDYLEIKATHIGGGLLQRIHEAVSRRRKLGQPIIIVGTTSSNDLFPAMSEAGFAAMQSGQDDVDYHTIVTPCDVVTAAERFSADLKSKIMQINLDNICACLREQRPSDKPISFLALFDSAPDHASLCKDCGELVWPAHKVKRIVNIMLSLASEKGGDLKTAFPQAWALIKASDQAKNTWLESAKKIKAAEDEDLVEVANAVDAPLAKSAGKLAKLSKTCNSHEKKLLSGIINAENINTTFSDVRAPPSTIEALKTLTSLSLIRPDAFKYGVLSTDKIPGLLLYGPPGTGKTLLAKAVAKECKATVLEVSGSNVFDKYVGEGEKNVRAIFSLAKKLSPCIVFIDEADAIFQSRGGTRNRTSHRELINQFLKEWDGMNSMSTFIMVATNRPFDLDDAVLRRLPRRLLVDLPTEKDRESILGIHLKGEALDPDVSLSDIATNTPFYSGSDLKNLSVAAALACVRDENEAAAKHTGDEEYKYPEKRTLTKAHFEKAMQEISASISEDMSSLTAIRKFDEQYGDLKGRRKKSGAYGFGTMSEKERESRREEDARVRTAENEVLVEPA
ncbi:MAG: hypothetical protein MMC23_005963 [Stictis urceolatum]|nr:hypothetical protein [Stictis urceolata]